MANRTWKLHFLLLPCDPKNRVALSNAVLSFLSIGPIKKGQRWSLNLIFSPKLVKEAACKTWHWLTTSPCCFLCFRSWNKHFWNRTGNFSLNWFAVFSRDVTSGATSRKLFVFSPFWLPHSIYIPWTTFEAGRVDGVWIVLQLSAPLSKNVSQLAQQVGLTRHPLMTQSLQILGRAVGTWLFCLPFRAFPRQ